MTLRVGSLCTGYGGLDLALRLIFGDIDLRWMCEYDKHPSTILDFRFPGVPNLGDITSLDYDALEPIDLLTAGYPCQPFSGAGKRRGKDDERHLWPYVADTVGRVRPRYVFLENVRGHVSLGLADVLADLSSLGYDARWGVVRAADAGAPHSRARVFILATDTSGERHGQGVHPRGVGRLDREDEGGARQRERARALAGNRGGAAVPHADGGDPAPDTLSERLDGSGDSRSEGSARGRGGDAARLADASAVAWGIYEPAIRRWERILGRPAPRPTEPGRDGERLSPRFVEWMMGLPAGWVTDVPGLSRNAQLKALGNGVVPQQAALAARALGAPAVEAAA